MAGRENPPTRIANVHLMRTGGTFINAYLSDILRDEFAVRISWFEGLGRDWKPKELAEFLAITHCPIYVHNHVAGWSEQLVHTYQRAGFYMFSFVRPVGDQLCSLYHWLKAGSGNAMSLTLDEFMRHQLQGGEFFGIDFRHWEIPEYWPLLDFVDVFSVEAFVRFITEVLRRPWTADSRWTRPINVSPSRGFASYCETGEIREETQQMLDTSAAQARFREIAWLSAAR